jgi:hypothetical protein
MTIGRHALSKAETITIAAIEKGVPLLAEARALIAAFQAMVRNKVDAELAAWFAQALLSLVASFASGVAKDEAGPRRDHFAVVEWTDGRSDHQAQARQTPDVRPGKDRSPPGSPHRYDLNCTKFAPEPIFHAE